MQVAPDVLTKFCALRPLHIVTQPYTWFNLAVIQFQVLSKRANGFASLNQAEKLFEPGSPLLKPDSVDVPARDWSLNVDDAIRFRWYLMMENLSEVIPANLLYTLRIDWTEVEKFRLQRHGLSLVSALLPESVINYLKITRPWHLRLEVVELDKDRTVVMRPKCQPTITVSYTIR